jgi:nucleoid DNA-binding protein
MKKELTIIEESIIDEYHAKTQIPVQNIKDVFRLVCIDAISALEKGEKFTIPFFGSFKIVDKGEQVVEDVNGNWKKERNISVVSCGLTEIFTYNVGQVQTNQKSDFERNCQERILHKISYEI